MHVSSPHTKFSHDTLWIHHVPDAGWSSHCWLKSKSMFCEFPPRAISSYPHTVRFFTVTRLHTTLATRCKSDWLTNRIDNTHIHPASIGTNNSKSKLVLLTWKTSTQCLIGTLLKPIHNIPLFRDLDRVRVSVHFLTCGNKHRGNILCRKHKLDLLFMWQKGRWWLKNNSRLFIRFASVFRN